MYVKCFINIVAVPYPWKSDVTCQNPKYDLMQFLFICLSGDMLFGDQSAGLMASGSSEHGRLSNRAPLDAMGRGLSFPPDMPGCTNGEFKSPSCRSF